MRVCAAADGSGLLETAILYDTEDLEVGDCTVNSWVIIPFGGIRSVVTEGCLRAPIPFLDIAGREGGFAFFTFVEDGEVFKEGSVCFLGADCWGEN